MKIKLGKVLITRGINDHIINSKEFAQFVHISLLRHQNADWGDCCQEDQKANTEALNGSGRLFSVYNDVEKIWIITEYDRSYTTILFPSEY